MATKKPARRRTAASSRRKPGPRKSVARKPRRGGFWQRRATDLAWFVAQQGEKHTTTVQSRKDAAILRATHQGCQRCGGNGQIFTKGKDGSFTGSKPCPAKPQTMKVSRLKVAAAARFGQDKRSGLCGWKCPCGKSEKPRYRDAKTATTALRTHERKTHGGAGVGGSWYAQVPDTKPAKTPAPAVTKIATGSGKTDAQWEKQNKATPPAKAQAQGKCWQCSGQGALYSAFGGKQLTTVCGECTGTGKAAAKAA
ncbi:MAG TPA: hypothetical protein DEQ61_09790 [Streptomyces sp.]|nr:hypothetical protein [Streptomyces sp.]